MGVAVAVKTITYYEREATNPTAKTVERLAEVFGITPAELMKDLKPPGKTKTGPPSRLENILIRFPPFPVPNKKSWLTCWKGFSKKPRARERPGFRILGRVTDGPGLRWRRTLGQSPVTTTAAEEGPGSTRIEVGRRKVSC